MDSGTITCYLSRKRKQQLSIRFGGVEGTIQKEVQKKNYWVCFDHAVISCVEFVLHLSMLSV